MSLLLALFCRLALRVVAQPRWTLVPPLGGTRLLSRLVITFLPRSKRLLISWLQSPSAVILEPPKIKSATVSSSISHEYPLISMHRLRAAFQSPFLTSASPSALETPQPPLHQSASPLRTLCTSVSLPHRSAICGSAPSGRFVVELVRTVLPQKRTHPVLNTVSRDSGMSKHEGRLAHPYATGASFLVLVRK